MSKAGMTLAAMMTALTCCTAAKADTRPLRQVEGGAVMGVKQGGLQVFKDIPYAAPPVGDLRWAEPHPVPAWQGTRRADTYGPACIPTNRRPDTGPVSEDCLSLNVFAPERPRKAGYPVIVWLHGGGFNDGSGGNDRFDGSALVREGAVVVTFNYRLGILANLSLPELSAQSPHHSSGALQALDQIAALRWVQRNIRRFGGDPNRVLLAGQSSGSIAVSILQTSPLAKGLFQRVLGMSGSSMMRTGAWPATPLMQAEEQGMQFMAELGAHSLAQLRAMPVEQLMAKAPFSLPAGVEGYVLPAHPSQIMSSGRQNDVPVLATFTRHEGFSMLHQVATLADYRAALTRLFDDKADTLFQLYPAKDDAQAHRQALLLANDGEFGRQMVLWAKMQAVKGKSPAYLAIFAEPSPSPVVNHGDDVAYWFGNFGTARGTAHAFEPGPAQLALSKAMRKLMVAYAATGIPSTKALAFRRFSAQHPAATVITDRPASAKLAAGLQWFLDHPDVAVGIGEKGFAAMTNDRVQTPNPH